MIKLPWRTVQPLKAWAEVTESIVLFPKQSLGHRPAHGEQVNLYREGQDRMRTTVSTCDQMGWLLIQRISSIITVGAFNPSANMFPTLMKHLLTHCWCGKCHGQTSEQSFHFKANNRRVYWRGVEKNIPGIFLGADIRDWMRQDCVAWGRNARWHNGEAWAGGGDDVVFLTTMFNLFCSTWIKTVQ